MPIRSAATRAPRIRTLAAASLLGAIGALAQAGTVTVITSFSKDLTDPYKKAFEAANAGIRLEVLNKNTTAAIAYIKELPAGQRPDVMWASAPDAFEVLARDKLLTAAPEVKNPHTPAKIGNYPINDPNGLYYGQALAGYDGSETQVPVNAATRIVAAERQITLRDLQIGQSLVVHREFAGVTAHTIQAC